MEIGGMKLNTTGMLVDFIRLKDKLDEIAGELDHIVLNEHSHFQSTDINPTAENLAVFFYSRLQNTFTGARVLRVEVYETDDYVAAYTPDE